MTYGKKKLAESEVQQKERGGESSLGHMILHECQEFIRAGDLPPENGKQGRG